MVPVIPFLCVFAAWAVEAGTRRLERNPDRGGFANPSARLVHAAMIGLVVLVPTLRLVQWNRIADRTDTRVLATNWFESQVPAGAKVGLVGWDYFRPQLWKVPDQLIRSLDNVSGRAHRLRTESILAHVLRGNVPAYEIYTFEGSCWRDALTPERLSAGQPNFVIVAEHPLWKPRAGDVPVLGPDYEPIMAFRAHTLSETRAVFDWQDAMCIPFANFDGVIRPGPNISVYRMVRYGRVAGSLDSADSGRIDMARFARMETGFRGWGYPSLSGR